MKILILLFSLLLCLQPVTGVCSSVAETKMLAKIDVSVENLLAGAASENLLNNQVNEIFSSLKKSLGQQLASGKVSALLYQKADQEFWIFDIHSPLVPKLRPFVPKSEKTSTTQEIELTSWTAGKLLLRKIEKERYLLLPSMDVSIIQPELMTNRVTVKNDIQITVYKPEWLEKFQYFRSIVPILGMMQQVKFILNGPQLKAEITCAKADQKNIRSHLTDEFRDSFEFVDGLNKQGGYNFWVRNAVMMIRSLSVKQRRKSLEVTAIVIENSNELFLRFFLPLIDWTAKRIAEPGLKFDCQARRDTFIAHLSLLLLKGVKVDVAGRRVQRSFRHLTQCPSGERYHFDWQNNQAAIISCSKHDNLVEVVK